jgi:glycosyltransferase involved in cell wall biosynthesis
MLVVVTIPAYNEEETLSSVIFEIKQVMDKTKYKYKILVVDDGSEDQTIKVAKKLGVVVVSKRHSGLLETFKREMEECVRLNADIVVHTDADGQYPAIFIPELIKEVEKGNDLVIGSRFSGEIEYMPFMKRVGNIAFAKVFTQICKTSITDSTTGFRAFTREVVNEIKYTTNFTYTQEQLIKASMKNFVIKEISISARKTRESRLMKGPFDYAMKAWINIFRLYRDYRPLAFFGKSGLVFLTMGLLLGLYVIYNVLAYGTSGGVPRVVLSALLILTGFQVILFGFLADMKK